MDFHQHEGHEKASFIVIIHTTCLICFLLVKDRFDCKWV